MVVGLSIVVPRQAPAPEMLTKCVEAAAVCIGQSAGFNISRNRCHLACMRPGRQADRCGEHEDHPLRCTWVTSCKYAVVGGERTFISCSSPCKHHGRVTAVSITQTTTAAADANWKKAAIATESTSLMPPTRVRASPGVEFAKTSRRHVNRQHVMNLWKCIIRGHTLIQEWTAQIATIRGAVVVTPRPIFSCPASVDVLHPAAYHTALDHPHRAMGPCVATTFGRVFNLMKCSLGVRCHEVDGDLKLESSERRVWKISVVETQAQLIGLY